jgi:hypothetical protein
MVKKYEDERSPLLGDFRTTRNWSASIVASAKVKEPTVTTVAVDSDDEEEDDSPFLLNLTTYQFWLIFGPILIQYFVAMFDGFLMVSSHPVITSYFNASNSASWLSTAFMLTSSSLQPIFGRMSDLFGRKPVYMSALLIFAFGTGLCAIAKTIGAFIFGRAVCGLGAGAMISLVCLPAYLET